MPEEAEDSHLTDERAACEAAKTRFRSFPILDRDVPADESAVDQVLDELCRELEDGKNVVVHCRQGIGRAGMIAAALLIRSGLSYIEAAERVSKARGVEVPETEEQRLWLRRFSEKRS
jgi:protein-tyrosine phosphatase